MAEGSSPDKGISSLSTAEKPRLIVNQPGKLRELNNLLQTFENLNARVSETVGEDHSGDMGGAGGGASGQQGDGQAISPREKAIRQMPSDPPVLREQLSKHIQGEMRALDRQAKKLATSLHRPGEACRLNELYAKIHHMNTLLHNLLEASLEVLQRLFIRVFIDKQPVL